MLESNPVDFFFVMPYIFRINNRNTSLEKNSQPLPAEESSISITFEKASKNYNGVHALIDFDLEIPGGELFGCLGPNGAGKTTAMKLGAGLVTPTSGRVLIDGFDIQKEPLTAKRFIGFIPDNPYIYETLTGREFLHYCAGLYTMTPRETLDAVARLLDLFQISDWADRRAGQYSHGMKQRIVMASAFLHNPKIILIDEPMVGLDPAAMRLVKKVLRDFVERGGAVFLSTHTLSDAEELCDRVGIIHRGRMVACGRLDEVRREGERLEDAFMSFTHGENALD